MKKQAILVLLLLGISSPVWGQSITIQSNQITRMYRHEVFLTWPETTAVWDGRGALPLDPTSDPARPCYSNNSGGYTLALDTSSSTYRTDLAMLLMAYSLRRPFTVSAPSNTCILSSIQLR